MCSSNLITELISYAIYFICFFIPLYYLYKFKKHKSKKKKNYFRAFIIAVIMFLLLYSVKLIAKLNDCSNCYINNECQKEVFKENTSTTTTTTIKTTSTTTTKVTTTTSTTTKKINTSGKEYKAVPVIDGTRVDVGKSDNGFDIYTVNGLTYVGDILIANKTYPLTSDFIPKNTYKEITNETKTCSSCINNIAYKAWTDMLADAKSLGLNIWIQSGYRSYNSQVNIYNSYVKRDGKEKADTYSSRPGHSDHQTSLAFDLNSISDAFTNTNEGKWVNENCYKYGFIIRFPKGKTEYTGYKYESWHLRYVGTDLSYILYNNGDWLSLEEYFGITSSYAE